MCSRAPRPRLRAAGPHRSPRPAQPGVARAGRSRGWSSGELPVDRVLLYPNVAKLEGASTRLRARWESDRVRLAGSKLFADGTLNSRTALMLSPYQEPLNDMPLGQMMATPAEISRAIELTTSLGLQLAVHAIGDGAVRMVLDVWEKASRNEGIGGIKRERARCIPLDAWIAQCLDAFSPHRTPANSSTSRMFPASPSSTWCAACSRVTCSRISMS